MAKKKSKAAKGKAKLKGKPACTKPVQANVIIPSQPIGATDTYGLSTADFRLSNDELAAPKPFPGAKTATTCRSDSTERDQYGDRRGRPTKPRLLWISTLEEESLKVLDYHHNRMYGSPLPRLRGPGSEEGRIWSEELDRSGL